MTASPPTLFSKPPYATMFLCRFYCALLTTCFGPDRWPSSGKMYTKYILERPLCMSMDPLSQLYKGKCHGLVILNKCIIKI
jgi:hypothetical protein